ncbi:MAG: hypothetical protein CL424_10830 [Acidimicrobiaceae bacterium]|nr:hypothetical protein [Acidimicrobiaceae bacterium]
MVVAGCGSSEDDGSASPATTTSEDTAAADTTAPDTGDRETDDTTASTAPATSQPVDGEAADDPACAPLAEPASIKISALQLLPYLPVHIAEHLGYFDEEGIDLTIENLRSSEALPLLGQGDIDYMIAPVSAQLFNAIDAGVELRWASPLNTANPESMNGLWVKAELFPPEEDEFDWTKMKGRTMVSSTGHGGVLTYVAGPHMLEAGMSIDDITALAMPSADLIVALENGSVDMAWAPSPFWERLVGNPDFRFVEGFPPEPASDIGIIAGPSMSDRPEVAAAFFRALMRAIEDNLQGGDYLEDEASRQLIAEAVGLEEADLDVEAPNLFDPRLDPGDLEAFTRNQQVMIDLGSLLEYDEPIPVEDLVDLRGLDAARECLS